MEFRLDHWPVSLALIVPFLAIATVRAAWGWERERRARRVALRSLIAPSHDDDGHALDDR